MNDGYACCMPIPEAEATSEIQRVADLLKSAEKPKSFAQLRKAVRLNGAELTAVLETAVAQSAVFRWPDYGGSQYFWSKSADVSGREAVLAVASEEALSRTSLTAQACRRVRGLSRSAMGRIVGNLISSRDLQAVPAFSSGKLLIPPGSAAPYMASARKFMQDKFRKAGLNPAELFTPASHHAPAPTPEPTVEAPERILDLIRSIEPVTGVPVTTQRLRQRRPDWRKQDFDAAALELSRRQEVSLSLHHDPHNLPEADRDLLIDGRDGSYYVAIAIRR